MGTPEVGAKKEDLLLCFQTPTWSRGDGYRWYLYEMYARQTHKKKALFIIENREKSETKPEVDEFWDQIQQVDKSVHRHTFRTNGNYWGAGRVEKGLVPQRKPPNGEREWLTLGGKRN